MPSDERIRELCAQLFRAEHPAVIETVSAQLHQEIDVYVRQKKAPILALDLQPSPDNAKEAVSCDRCYG